MWDGVREGVGKLLYGARGSYHGSWIQGKPDGLGFYRDRFGSLIQCGEFKANQLVRACPVPRSALPAGVLTHPDDTLFPDGSIFRGPLNEQSQPHGRGSMHRVDGAVESRGDWTAGVLSGLGLLRYSNGEVYEGQIANGKRKGLGILWNADGKLLKCGAWGSSWLWEVRPNPVPCRFIPFGEKLTAATRAASLFYPSGDYFVGPLNAQDQPHGVGALHASDGSVKQQGTWQAGQFVG